MNKIAEKKLRLAIGVSGSGRSLANLLERQNNESFEVAMVFSSSEVAGANQIARQHDLPLFVMDFSRAGIAQSKHRLYEALQKHRIDLVVLAGFLKLLPLDDSWEGKIINIHPALLPKFGGRGMHGRHVHEAVLRAGEKVSGATVHFVDAKYDEGGVIAQVQVKINPDDNADTLSQKVFEAECRLLPAVISAMANGQLPRTAVAQLNSKGGFV